MSSAVPEGAFTEGLPSLEVRWIFPGQLDTAVAGWFSGFQPEAESREDAYLLDPGLGGLSVKVRAGRALEVKMFLGSPGILDFPGRARGRMQYWRKWSFPFSPLSLDTIDPGGWRRVRKQRQVIWFSPAGERIARAPAVPARTPARRPGARRRSPNCACRIRACGTRNGGPWAWKRPGPPTRSAMGSRPPLRSSSPRPCRAASTCVSTTPGRMRTGFARADLKPAAHHQGDPRRHPRVTAALPRHTYSRRRIQASVAQPQTGGR